SRESHQSCVHSSPLVCTGTPGRFFGAKTRPRGVASPRAIEERMENRVPRRDFLKATPAAAGLLAIAARARASATRLPVVAVADYPIHPIAFSEVTVKDTFWKPKIDTNASVTTPLEFRKAPD